MIKRIRFYLKDTCIFLLKTTLIVFLFVSCIPKAGDTLPDFAEYGFKDTYEPEIDSILKLLTLEEKIHMIHGIGMFVSGGVERLGIPELKYTDGPSGIREELERDSWIPLDLDTDSVTFFPTGTALAATWNVELAYRYGKQLAVKPMQGEKIFY
jgi:beta-glucosidase